MWIQVSSSSSVMVWSQETAITLRESVSGEKVWKSASAPLKVTLYFVFSSNPNNLRILGRFSAVNC